MQFSTSSVASAAAVALMASAGMADVVSFSVASTDGQHTYDVALDLSAGSQQGTGWTYDADTGRLEVGTGSGTIDDGQGGTVDYLAAFTNLSVSTVARRSGGLTVNLNFDATAGFTNSVMTINAAPVATGFSSGVMGDASAAITIVDNPFSPGASLDLNGGFGGIYTALVNGSDFQNLHATSLTATGGGSNSRTESFGPTGIGGAVSDISARWSFSLSALDTATGTSTFTVVPGAGSLSILAVGGLVASRRRRA